jgi:hypothetical protein
VNNEFENTCGSKRSSPNLKYYPGISLEGLRNTPENLIENDRSLSSDFKLGPPEYKARMIPTLP